MAKPTKKSTTSTKVTRIKASDTGASKTKKTTPKAAAIKDQKTVKAAAPAAKKTKSDTPKQKAIKREAGSSSRNPLVKFGRYLKGAWYEIRQVRWPNRAETWKMTGALLAFTGFFVGLILLLDTVFKYLFELLIG